MFFFNFIFSFSQPSTRSRTQLHMPSSKTNIQWQTSWVNYLPIFIYIYCDDWEKLRPTFFNYMILRYWEKLMPYYDWEWLRAINLQWNVTSSAFSLIRSPLAWYIVAWYNKFLPSERLVSKTPSMLHWNEIAPCNHRIS